MAVAQDGLGRDGPRQVGAGQGAHPGLAPEPDGRRLAPAGPGHVEPQEEPALRTVESKSIAENSRGIAGLGAVKRTIR